MSTFLATLLMSVPTSAVSNSILVAQDPASEARAGLEKAEERARLGHYDEARLEYKSVAAKFPDTPSGKLAAERAKPSAYLGFADVVRNGPSKNRIDVVLMGDGYELEHMAAFDKLAEDIPPLFARQATFREYYSYFNFLRACLVSADSGIDGFGRQYDTALNGHTLDTFAGHCAVDRGLVMNVLAQIPDTDSLAIVFVKTGVLGTGGGGVATIGGREVKTVIHEWGHAFGGLSDEYDTQTSHEQGPAHDGINVAASGDPKTAPWAHWITAKVPGVGMYEGALGRVKGAWRPTSTGCVMATDENYCVVCQEALVLRTYSIVDPIENSTPVGQPQGLREPYKVGDEPFEIRVQVMKPATHSLEVSWWILPEARLPKSGDAKSSTSKFDTTGGEGPKDRRKRGKLSEITDTPKLVNSANTSGEHLFRISRTDLAPGRYRVICRVKDTTKLRSDRFPWVLKDDLDLLQSERGWWIEIPSRN